MFAESTDEEQIIDRVAALDIGKAELARQRSLIWSKSVRLDPSGDTNQV